MVCECPNGHGQLFIRQLLYQLYDILLIPSNLAILKDYLKEKAFRKIFNSA